MLCVSLQAAELGLAQPPPNPALPPLFHALLSDDDAHVAALIQGGTDPLVALGGGLTSLHAAALGGCAAAVPLMAAAGAPLEAQLAAASSPLVPQSWLPRSS